MKTSVVYTDLDGVLVQFARGAIEVHESLLSFTDITQWNMWDLMHIPEADFYAPMGFDFWSTLAAHADGMVLFGYLRRWTGGRVGLLSSPISTAGCRDGKVAWVEKHLPAYAKTLFIGPDKSIHAGPDRLLIDDSDSNVAAFTAAGGRAVLVPRLWNAARDACDSAGEFDPRDLWYGKVLPVLVGG